LSWEKLEDNRACRIAVYADVKNDDEMIDWSIEKLIEFNKVKNLYNIF